MVLSAVVGFTLVNADTDRDIAPLVDGGYLDLNTLPTTNLNVRADTDAAPVGSVFFDLDSGTATQTENVAPYALFGDSSGDYNAGSFAVGSHTLAATPYSEANAGGMAGTPLTVGFTVSDGGLQGEYFNEAGLTGSAGVFVDPTVDFPNDALGDDAGGRVNSDDLYSIRWTGYVKVDQGGSWQFTTFSNDGVRLWVDGTQLIDHWDQHAVARDDGTLTLDQPGWYPITLEYFQDGGTTHIELIYSGPGFTEAIIPTTHLATAYPSGAPVADAGPDRVVVLPDDSVTLDGSGSDPNGSITAYQWTQVSGPSTASLSSDDTEDLTASNLVQGTYVFELTVTDNENNTASDQAVVNVVASGGGVVIGGELRQWHKVTLTLDGPSAGEEDSLNPFLDYRMNVTFTHVDSGLTYVVPGYFAADGDAGNTSATSGNKWRAHLAPDHAGTWNYAISFRTGTELAVSDDPAAGAALDPYDGLGGSFTVAETDKTGRDFRGKGRLEYVGGHYLQFAETGEYFLKQGADAPENLLAYADFDGGFKTDGISDNRIKTWTAHVGDWNTGDPTWQGDKGKGLIGAVNYLASEGLNAFSFLTMNIQGDDRNVFPYLDYNDYERIDVSRMDQWETVLEHADRMGMYLHFKTQETENDQLLDGGALGTQRKLYYRELIARFSHHLALNWNLGEENTNTTQQRKDFAQYFHDNDPYQHNIVLHTYPGQKDSVYTPLLGSASELTGLSLQTSNAKFTEVHSDVATWVTNSDTAGKRWVVAVDEPGNASDGIIPDSDDDGTTGPNGNHTDGRKNALWGTFMAGGWGNEWYFGYQHAHSDLTCEDFRSRDAFWDYARYALQFFVDNSIPVWEMQNDNAISTASNDYGFYKPGEVYVAYLKDGGTTSIDLTAAAPTDTFEVKWFDPRNGGALQDGTITEVAGGGTVSIGSPPSATTEDWTALVRLASLETSVVDRHVFYNNSYYDGNDPAANAADFAAIVPHTPLSGHGSGTQEEPGIELGKDALLPGETAGYENYTSAAAGLNGVMVDVANLANPAGLDPATDFLFRIGNDDNPDGWIQLAGSELPSVTVFEGQGTSASDRITLTWPDGTVVNTWLQVTVLATDDSGLPAIGTDTPSDQPAGDVFYFGNAVGESNADNAADTVFVTVADELKARNSPHDFLDRADVYDPYDHNKDSSVTVADEMAARHNTAFGLEGFRLIAAPPLAPPPSAPEVLEPPANVSLLHDAALTLAADESSEDIAAPAEQVDLSWLDALTRSIPERPRNGTVDKPGDAVAKLLATL